MPEVKQTKWVGVHKKGGLSDVSDRSLSDLHRNSLNRDLIRPMLRQRLLSMPRCFIQQVEFSFVTFAESSMRNSEFKRSLHLSNMPVYTFDTDESFGRVLRDPMAVLLGRSSLSLQPDSTHTDPYNRVGRLTRAG